MFFHFNFKTLCRICAAMPRAFAAAPNGVDFSTLEWANFA